MSFTDISFYLSIALVILQHADAALLQKSIPILQKVYDFIKTIPGITP